MSRRRFYATPEDISDSTITLSTNETHHLTHVLRMKPTDQAFVFDGCGHEYKCTFRSLADNRAQMDVTETLSDVVESPLQLTLAQALAKGEKFDLILQKATELGVSRIVPLMTRYADVKLDDQQTLRRVERWRRISLEALKQCGRRRLVEITTPQTLPNFLDSVTHSDVAYAANESVAQAAGLRIESRETSGRKLTACATLLLFSEKGGAAITEALSEMPEPPAVVALVGPEGGWSDEEIEMLASHGAKPVSLGPRVLRTETAAVVAITLIQHLTGDLSVRGNE
jgi:16S rRNA (uracil1498-N3)-methyltransferase